MEKVMKFPCGNVLRLNIVRTFHEKCPHSISIVSYFCFPVWDVNMGKMFAFETFMR